MTLLENEGFEYIEDSTEERRKRRLKGAFERQELSSAEAISMKFSWRGILIANSDS